MDWLIPAYFVGLSFGIAFGYWLRFISERKERE